MPAPNHILNRAIQLYRSGNARESARVLAKLLLSEPDQPSVWAWFSHVCPEQQARRAVLEEVYKSSSNQVEIRQNYERLKERLGLTHPTPASATHREEKPAHFPAGKLFSLGLLIVALALVVWQTGKAASYSAAIQQLSTERDQLQNNLEETSSQLAENKDQLRQLKYDFQVLSNRKVDLQSRYDQLKNDYDQMMTEYGSLQQRYSGLNDDYLSLEQNSVRPPYIVIAGREVDMAFKRTDENILHWKVGFDVLEANIERGQTSRNSMFNVLGRVEGRYALDMPAPGGGSFRVVDYRLFVDPGPFAQVMKSVYNQAPDEESFLRETWNIMAQLTTYAFDPDRETPRYPLETLLAGGGDCEDTSILFASLVKAAPVNWKLYFIYMDSDHPDKLVEPNHLAVAVDTGNQTYVIETTSKSVMSPYNGKPDGWYLAVE